MKVKLPVAFRRQPPAARTVLITDGLQYTDHSIYGWSRVPGKPKDWLTPEAADAHTINVAKALPGLLGTGRPAHLKMVWSRLSSAPYVEGMQGLERRAGRCDEFIDLTADRIDSLDLAQLQVFLGSELATRHGGAVAGLRASIESAAGLPSGVSAKEERDTEQVWSQLAARAERSPLGAVPASAAEIAWLLAREQRCPSLWLPAPTGRLEGAGVARLMNFRVKPQTDHVELRTGGACGFATVLVGANFEDLQNPGGEWLEWLVETPEVQADFSARLVLESTSDAVKRWREVEKSAREQVTSAEASSSQEAPEEVYETRDAAREQILRLRREGLAMTISDPRWIVTASSREQLDARVDALSQFYGDRGIDLYRPEHQQKQLWLEQLPGDQARIDEYYQYQPAITLAGSWFYAGSRVGDADGPYIGQLSGRHPGIVRMNVLAAAGRGDATTIMFLGKSGSGKTTAIMLACLDAALGGAWVTLVDIKGDCGGLVDVAADWGLASQLVQLGRDTAGVLDPFGYMPASAAKTEATAQLLGMLPMDQRSAAESYVLAAAELVAASSEPCTAEVISRLQDSADPIAARIGADLTVLAAQDLAMPVAGRRAEDSAALDTSRGVRVLQFPGTELPRMGDSEANWNLRQRLSMVAFRSAVGYSTYVANTLRHMPKLVALPELGRLISTADGSGFVDAIARTGRALKTNLLIDSQVAVDVARSDALKEQATFVFAFEASSRAEQDAIAEILNAEPSDDVRAKLTALAPMITGADGVRRKVKGHCVVRDREGNIDTMTWDARTRAILDGLSTTPPEDISLTSDTSDIKGFIGVEGGAAWAGGTDHSDLQEAASL